MSNKKKILIAEDSISARLYLCKKVNEANYETIEAKNGIETIEKMQIHTPSAIVLDLLMPEVDGIKVLNYIKENKIKIPVIVLSADIQDVVREECLALGAVQFLNKPTDVEMLIESLNRIVEI